MKVLALLIQLLLCAILAFSRTNIHNKFEKSYRSKKTNCENVNCAHLIPAEAYNCVNLCLSSLCYNEVYAESPLEDGEIDLNKNRLFLACLKKEKRSSA
jgi:hypothetical protein